MGNAERERERKKEIKQRLTDRRTYTWTHIKTDTLPQNRQAERQ
jgi:hypothetical protein